jgi:uncharacterized protein (TIGR02145 family)
MSMSYKFLLKITLIFILLFGACKKKEEDVIVDVPQSSNGDELFASFQMMNAANIRFIQIGDSMNITPPEALYYTSLWVQNQPGVAEAFTMDSTYLFIYMANGYKNTISLREMTPNGLSVYRGSGAGTGKMTASVSSTGGTCSNKLQNKKVLLYSAFVEQFYPGTEFQTKVIDMIENSSVDVDVTVLRDGQCTIDALLTCNQYGLVILDTHGGYASICTGVNFTLDSASIPDNVNDYLTLIGQKIGSQHIQAVVDQKIGISYAFEYDPQLQNQAQWDKYKQNLNVSYEVVFTSKGIREMMPDLSNTIVFANACYSGFTATSWMSTNVTPRQQTNPDPIKLAWMTRNPLTYYGYEANDGVSYKAPNAELCRPAEDTLIKSFFYDGDSTGNAHMQEGGGSAIMEYPWNMIIAKFNDHGPLRFNQYANTTWCYGNCGDTITDIRDGQKYATTCIGDQIWMAENLNWAGAGVCYDNISSNCDTYGRLYSLDEATGQNLSTDTSHVQGVCPQGWHIPSKAEFEELITFAGGPTAAAAKLSSTTGWPTPNSNTNEYNFGLLPGGNFVASQTNSQFSGVGTATSIWTSSKDSIGDFYYAMVVSSTVDLWYYSPPPSLTWKFSCRCVKD